MTEPVCYNLNRRRGVFDRIKGVFRMAGLKSYTCSKCGGTLVLDQEKKLYLCSHCGVAYDYSLFFGNPMQKAVELLKYGEFEEADQRFGHILLSERRSMDALRGRVLCAGRWKTFANIRLTQELTEVDWQLVLHRADECCKWETDLTRLYFALLRETMELLKQYSDTIMMMQIEPDNTKYQEIQKGISEKYPKLLRRFMYFDRMHHQIAHDYTKIVYTRERLEQAFDALKHGDFTEAESCFGIQVLEHPNEPKYLRCWILSAGKWTEFWKMQVTDYRSDRLFVILSQRVTEARELAPEEYNDYFDTLFELIMLIRKYHENELISKTGKYENDRSDIRKEFKDLLDDFLKIDRELFEDNVSS